MAREPLEETCPAPASWLSGTGCALPGDTCTRGGHRETLVDGMLSMRINLKGAAHLNEKTCCVRGLVLECWWVLTLAHRVVSPSWGCIQLHTACTVAHCTQQILCTHTKARRLTGCLSRTFLSHKPETRKTRGGGGTEQEQMATGNY